MEVTTASNPQSGLSMNISPESSPGSKGNRGRASAELAYRSTSVFQGAEMYRTKTQAQQARVQARALKNRINALKKKEDQAHKLIVRTAMDEEFKLHMLEEKVERQKVKQKWKEELDQRTQALRSRLQTERENSLRRKQEALQSISEQRRFIVNEAKQTRADRDYTIRQLKEREREAKHLLKKEIKQREEDAIGRNHTLQETSIVVVKETYAQQMELQRRMHLEAMLEAEELQRKAEEVLRQYKVVEEEKEKVVVRKKRFTPSPHSAG